MGGFPLVPFLAWFSSSSCCASSDHLLWMCSVQEANPHYLSFSFLSWFPVLIPQRQFSHRFDPPPTPGASLEDRVEMTPFVYVFLEWSSLKGFPLPFLVGPDSPGLCCFCFSHFEENNYAGDKKVPRPSLPLPTLGDPSIVAAFFFSFV